MSDLIERQAAIDAIDEAWTRWDVTTIDQLRDKLHELFLVMPSAQPEPSIPFSWIEKQIDWLKSMDNEFANLTAMNISTMVKKWKKEQEGNDGSD